VGDGDLREGLCCLALQLGISDRVHFAGSVSDAQLRAHYEAADLFVLTSSNSAESFEGFGIVYLEANSFGVPVLGARNGGAIDAICEGTSGFFADEPSLQSVEECLRKFLSKEVRFDPTKCRLHAENFSWQACVDPMEQAYIESLFEQPSS
jgi:phosphatidylinositol alpha-1,6-mannosyltransferase